jgi:hypothetical protein
LLGLLVGSAGCGGPALPPEEQIRATLVAAERDAQTHDLAALLALIAPDYADTQGRDKAALASLLRFHFLRNPRIHLLVRVREIEVDAPGRARVEALVATAGRPIPLLEALAETNADLLWVDLELARRDDAWAVTGARWERARLEDLL